MSGRDARADDEKLLTELVLLKVEFERGVAVQSYQHLIERAYSRILELKRIVERPEPEPAIHWPDCGKFKSRAAPEEFHPDSAARDLTP